MTPSLFGRLTAPVALLSVFLLVIAFGSAWYVRSLQRTASDLIASNVASMQAAQELEISLREVRTQFTRYFVTQDEAHLIPIPRLISRTADALETVERRATTPDEQLLMKRTRAAYEHFFEEYDRLLREREQWGYPKIIEQTDAVFEKEILEPAQEYLRLNEGVLTSSTAANQRMADQITIGLVALGLCGAAGGTVIAVAIRRSPLSAGEKLRLTVAELGLEVPHMPVTDGHPASSDPLEQMRRSASAVLARLRQTERDALRAEQLAWVGHMAAFIAHEDRNPLTAINLLVQAAAERRGRGSFKGRDLQVLEEEILRLEQIVSGFLDFARPPRLEPRPNAIGRFASQYVTVLVTRESGSGKELVTRALYQHSRRADRPFLAIKCAAIPDSLLESERFGHEKGAFTGADRQRVGKFERASDGTLFLDEIGDMAAGTQAKVLRVLQEQRFERVGGRESVTCDVRLFAATNRPLDELVAAGRFRQDPLYRLNGVTIHLPPLRERPRDLVALVEHFVRQLGTGWASRGDQSPRTTLGRPSRTRGRGTFANSRTRCGMPSSVPPRTCSPSTACRLQSPGDPPRRPTLADWPTCRSWCGRWSAAGRTTCTDR